MLHLFQKKNVTLPFHDGLGLAAVRTASNQPLRSRCSSAAQPQLQLAPGKRSWKIGGWAGGEPTTFVGIFGFSNILKNYNITIIPLGIVVRFQQLFTHFPKVQEYGGLIR
jgi:hypothetical protein